MHVGTTMSFQLGGALHLHDRRNTLSQCSWMIEPRYAWREAWEGHHFRALLLEWSQDVIVDEAFIGTTRPTLQQPIEQLAAALHVGDSAQADDAVGVVLARLRAEGLQIPAVPPTPRSAVYDRAVAVLNSARTSLARQPQWIDALVLRSERQLRRDLRALFTALHMPNLGFRSLLLRERLASATALLGSTQRIEEVARAVGYGSSRALATALQRAGLLDATELRRRLRRSP